MENPKIAYVFWGANKTKLSRVSQERCSFETCCVRRKKKEIAPSMSVDTLLESVYDIWQKKALLDIMCAGGDTVLSTLEEYVKQYWREKLGLRKLARAKLAGM